MSDAVGQVDLKNYPLLRRGKVRDVFDLGDDLLLVATDRISAFDVVLPSLLPMKGVILTDISLFWFDQIRQLVPTQLTDTTIDDLNLAPGEFAQVAGRSVIVRKAERIDIECVVRAWLAGSAWLEYRNHGTVSGIPMPRGLRRGDRLPSILFTPAFKNDNGHDENISIERLQTVVGAELANELESASRSIFELGTNLAADAGFNLADSKFEFGWIDGKLSVIDEVLTPDSSRYWDAGDVVPGYEPAAYDKQIIRDWLEQSGWNKETPGPMLPNDIIEKTLDRYRSVADKLRNTTLKGA